MLPSVWFLYVAFYMGMIGFRSSHPSVSERRHLPIWPRHWLTLLFVPMIFASFDYYNVWQLTGLAWLNLVVYLIALLALIHVAWYEFNVRFTSTFENRERRSKLSKLTIIQPEPNARQVDLDDYHPTHALHSIVQWFRDQLMLSHSVSASWKTLHYLDIATHYDVETVRPKNADIPSLFFLSIVVGPFGYYTVKLLEQNWQALML